MMTASLIGRLGQVLSGHPPTPVASYQSKRMSHMGVGTLKVNQYFDTVATDPPETSQYTIILITKKDFVFTDQTDVFYETRLK